MVMNLQGEEFYIFLQNGEVTKVSISKIMDDLVVLKLIDNANNVHLTIQIDNLILASSPL
jgi:hypothetical protein